MEENTNMEEYEKTIAEIKSEIEKIREENTAAKQTISELTTELENRKKEVIDLKAANLKMAGSYSGEHNKPKQTMSEAIAGMFGYKKE